MIGNQMKWLSIVQSQVKFINKKMKIFHLNRFKFVLIVAMITDAVQDKSVSFRGLCML